MTKMLKMIAFIFPLLIINLGHTRDKSSGCGLGWKVSKRMSITSSSVRLSTNSFTTPYGMTSGTSGCKRHSIVQKESKQIHFVEENLDQLELEMSIGKGQFVEQLASLLGCENKVGAFTKTMQKSLTGSQDTKSMKIGPTQKLQDFGLNTSCGISLL